MPQKLFKTAKKPTGHIDTLKGLLWYLAFRMKKSSMCVRVPSNTAELPVRKSRLSNQS